METYQKQLEKLRRLKVDDELIFDGLKQPKCYLEIRLKKLVMKTLQNKRQNKCFESVENQCFEGMKKSYRSEVCRI